MKQFHECELKLKIANCVEQIEIEDILKGLGYKYNMSRLERDYIIDDSNFSLRKKKCLFRVRTIIMEQKMNILFTLKIKGTSNDFQDNIEVETFACDDNKDIANKITKYIKNQINIQIPNEIFNMDQLCDILKKLERIGLVPYNIVEKKRKEFVGRKAKVLFDEFPNPVGTYLEIEAGNETDLFDTIKQLGLEDKRLDKRNYGRIIAEATNGASKCLFDSKI